MTSVLRAADAGRVLRAMSAARMNGRQRPAAAAGLDHGAVLRTRRLPGRSIHRSNVPVSSAEAANNGPAPGSTVSAEAIIASTTGIGSTPRRARAAAANRPCRTTVNSQPPRSSGRATTNSRIAASAPNRWRRSAAAANADSRSRATAA